MAATGPVRLDEGDRADRPERARADRTRRLADRALDGHDDGSDGCKPHLALKYDASGWWTTMASVACSGCSWNSSDSSTPMRAASSRSTIFALSSSSGHAG